MYFQLPDDDARLAETGKDCNTVLLAVFNQNRANTGRPRGLVPQAPIQFFLSQVVKDYLTECLCADSPHRGNVAPCTRCGNRLVQPFTTHSDTDIGS